MISASIFGYPDPQLKYTVDTGASNHGVGSVLSQEQDNREKVIAYYSNTLSNAEKNYCVTRRELLAVVRAVKHFRPYLYGQRFKVQTDHASLIWLCRRSQVARWLELLSEFNYTIEYRPGKRHGNADGMSRLPCSECKQCARIQSSGSGPTQQEVLDEWEASGFASVNIDQGEVGPLTNGVEGHQRERVAALQTDNDSQTSKTVTGGCRTNLSCHRVWTADFPGRTG